MRSLCPFQCILNDVIRHLNDIRCKSHVVIEKPVKTMCSCSKTAPYLYHASLALNQTFRDHFGPICGGNKLAHFNVFQCSNTQETRTFYSKTQTQLGNCAFLFLHLGYVKASSKLCLNSTFSEFSDWHNINVMIVYFIGWLIDWLINWIELNRLIDCSTICIKCQPFTHDYTTWNNNFMS